MVLKRILLTNNPSLLQQKKATLFPNVAFLANDASNIDNDTDNVIGNVIDVAHLLLANSLNVPALLYGKTQDSIFKFILKNAVVMREMIAIQKRLEF